MPNQIDVYNKALILSEILTRKSPKNSFFFKVKLSYEKNRHFLGNLRDFAHARMTSSHASESARDMRNSPRAAVRFIDR